MQQLKEVMMKSRAPPALLLPAEPGLWDPARAHKAWACSFITASVQRSAWAGESCKLMMQLACGRFETEASFGCLHLPCRVPHLHWLQHRWLAWSSLCCSGLRTCITVCHHMDTSSEYTEHRSDVQGLAISLVLGFSPKT